jgi:hypothetical protein
MCKYFIAIMSLFIMLPVSAAPRPGGVYENTVNTTLFAGQRRIIRGKLSRNVEIRFETNEGQVINFLVTKARKKGGARRVTYLIPSVDIVDEFGNSLSNNDNNDMFAISGQLIILDERIIGGLQRFPALLLVPSTTFFTGEEISTVAPSGEVDSVFKYASAN